MPINTYSWFVLCTTPEGLRQYGIAIAQVELKEFFFLFYVFTLCLVQLL